MSSSAPIALIIPRPKVESFIGVNGGLLILVVIFLLTLTLMLSALLVVALAVDHHCRMLPSKVQEVTVQVVGGGFTFPYIKRY